MDEATEAFGPVRRRVLLGLVLLLCLSACRVTVRVGIDAKRDGSGTVTVSAQLDREAAAAIPDLAQQLQTSDLVRSGWRIVGPTPVGGGIVVVASKSFHDTGALQPIVAEISGPGGPFHDLRLDRTTSLFKTRTTFRGTVDLTCGLRCFGDPQLQATLGGRPDLGLDPARLQQATGVVLDRLLQFEVEVGLPGRVRSSHRPEQIANSVTWQPKMGQRSQLLATSQTWNRAPVVVAIGLAAVAVALLVVLVVLGIRRRRRRRRRRAHSRRRKKAGVQADQKAKVEA